MLPKNDKRRDNATSESTLTGEYKFDVSKDAMEIQFSPDGKRPTQFSPKDNDFYFLRLTIKKQ